MELPLQAVKMNNRRGYTHDPSLMSLEKLVAGVRLFLDHSLDVLKLSPSALRFF